MCNYWKRFAYPQVGYDQAFISVLSDDGSVYSDVASENTFGVGQTLALTTALSANVIDFVGTYGGPASFLQVTNTHGSIALTGELNGDTNLIFTLAAGQSQIFNSGDLSITMLRVKSASNGGTCFIIASVKSAVNS